MPRLILALVALTVGVFLSRGGPDTTNAAGTYNANTAVALSSTAASTVSDIDLNLTIPSPDYNFSSVINATPAGGFVAPGPGHPSYTAGTDPGPGEVMALLSSSSTLGLANGGCVTSVSPVFHMLNATVDITDVIQPVPASAANSGDGGVLANMWSDHGGSRSAGNVDAADAPWGALGGWADTAATITALTPAEQANGLPAQVDDYPAFLNTLFTPDGGSPVQPLARYAGAENVNGSAIFLDLVIFAPNVLSSAFAPPHPFADLKDIGYTSIAVLNDPTAAAAPSSITDFCTGLGTITTVYGEGRTNPCNGVTAPPCNTPINVSKPGTSGASTGRDRYRNPAAGTALFINYHGSARDSDDDGIENGLDTCPLSGNPDSWNPRSLAFGGDSDSDGIANTCDTSGQSDDDNDDDGWQNRLDNCPLLTEPLGIGEVSANLESELGLTYGLPDLVAQRGGPRSDGIGDLCDPNDTKASGIYLTTLNVVAKCIGGTDADSDGWCATTTPASLNDPNDANASRTPEDYDLVFTMPVSHSGAGATPPMRQPVQVCNDGVDNDGDTLIDLLDAASGSSSCRPKGLVAGDLDGDGYSDEIERHVGTDALGRCEAGAVPAQSTDWPSDFISGSIPNSTDKVTLGDLTSFLAPRRLDTSPGAANFNVRWDLSPGPGIFGTWININDLTALISGSSGTPPMFGGATRAFSGPLCTTAIPYPYGD